MENKIFRVRANAKVNLALHVIGRRSDGLHLLDSLVAFPEYGDELLFKNGQDFSLSISGPFGEQLRRDTLNSSNIIMQAAKLLKDDHDGVAIELIKNIPVASGIGGGSSNAAITLRTLAELWKKKLPKMEDVLKLGSDVPVCLSSEFQRMQGIGERLEVLSAPPPIWIVLANPGIKVPTGKIFDLLNCKQNNKLEPFEKFTELESFLNYLSRQRNDLEIVTSNLFPEVRAMLKTINDTSDCKLCRMSGSGATCFGLYINKISAQKAKEVINKTFRKAWVVAAPIFSINPSHNIIS